MDPHRAAWNLVGVLLLAAIVLLAGGSTTPLLDPDEARFARTSVEMLRTGDLVVPQFEGEPRLVKPPLLHWTHAALFSAFGPSELAARIPAIGSTLLTILLTAWIASRRFGPEGAMWSAAMVSTLPLVVAIGKIGTIDALLAVHVLGVVALDIAEPEEVGNSKVLAMGALLGLAFLAKGPVGIALPAVVVLAGRAASGRGIRLGLHPTLLALAGTLAIVLPWTLAFGRRLGFDRVFTVVDREVLQRVAEGTTHARPAWFYLAVLFVGGLPWAVPALAGIARMSTRASDPATRTARYAAAGLAAGMALLSLSRDKLPNYMLPLFPLVALLATWELGQELESPEERRTVPAVLVGVLVALMLALGALTTQSRLPVEARETALYGAAAFGVAALGAAFGVFRARPRWVYSAAYLGTLGFLLALGFGLFPWLGTQRSARDLVDRVAALRSARPVVLVDTRLPSLTYYADRIPERIERGQVLERIGRGDGPLLIIDTDDLPKLPPEALSRLAKVGSGGKYTVWAPSGPPVPGS